MIKPLFNNILVQQVKEERKTASGIILETTVDTSSTFKSVVIAKGPDAVESINVGDTIVLSRYQRGTDIEHEGKLYILTPDKDVLASL